MQSNRFKEKMHLDLWSKFLSAHPELRDCHNAFTRSEKTTSTEKLGATQRHEIVDPDSDLTDGQRYLFEQVKNDPRSTKDLVKALVGLLAERTVKGYIKELRRLHLIVKTKQGYRRADRYKL